MSEELIKRTELDLKPLDEQTKDIAQKILDEQDIDKVKNLTNLFNLNAQKRNVMRVLKMNGLLDAVTDQIVERFEKRPDNFSNEELLKYMQVTENAIDRANKNLHLVEETPPIQYQQNNQVNINIVDTLDRDSKDRVLEYVNSVLKMGNNTEVIELEEDEVNAND
jgi:hypothetical protein